jgi:sensor histidine kinase YesM
MIAGPVETATSRDGARPPRPILAFARRMLVIVSLGGVVCALIFLALGQPRQPSEFAGKVLVCFIYSCCIAPPSALLANWLLPRVIRKHPRLFIPSIFSVLVTTSVTGSLLAALCLVGFGFIGWHEYWPEFKSSVGFSIVICLVFGTGVSSYETVRRRLEWELRTRQVEEERARKLLAEARLSSLQSRIHPHFLFNTLNSIAALIPVDPARAEDMVGRLASLLRFSLNTAHSGTTTLEQELRIVRDYLEIEQARFGPRLRYRIDAPKELENASVPPLALQSLVENSVKHVIAQRSGGGEIVVSANATPEGLSLKVSDDGPGFALEDVPKGHGLDNLMSRLAILYGPGARVTAERNAAHSFVQVSLPRQGIAGKQ